MRPYPVVAVRKPLGIIITYIIPTKNMNRHHFRPDRPSRLGPTCARTRSPGGPLVICSKNAALWELRVADAKKEFMNYKVR